MIAAAESWRYEAVHPYLRRKEAPSSSSVRDGDENDYLIRSYPLLFPALERSEEVCPLFPKGTPVMNDHPECMNRDDGPPPMSIEELIHLMHMSGEPVIADTLADEDWRHDMGDSWGGWRSDGGWGE